MIDLFFIFIGGYMCGVGFEKAITKYVGSNPAPPWWMFVVVGFLSTFVSLLEKGQ